MTPTDPALPNQLAALLNGLRKKIRSYVLLEGICLTVLVLGVLFWCSLAIDWGYFRIQRAELPIWTRFLIEVAALSLAAGVGLIWGLARAARTLQQRALALVLERRFPELNDRLITAVELAHKTGGMSPLSQAMLARTVEELEQVTERLDLNQVFDRQPLFRAGISASVAVISVAIFAVSFGDTFGLWFRRNVLLANEAWRRETALRVSAIAQPGDREVEFVRGVYKHPRGSDLVLRAAVVSGFKAPPQVEARYRFADSGQRNRAYFARHGREEFQLALSGVTSSLEFRLFAGDAERIPYYVEVVDPPKIDALRLDCLFPEYTGLNTLDEETGKRIRTPRPVQGTRIAVPSGTDFLLQAESNKPLRDVRIQTEHYDVELTAEAVRLTRFDDSGNKSGVATEINVDSPWLAADKRHFHVPFLIGRPSLAKPANDQPEATRTSASVLPLPLEEEAVLKITLHDADDITSQEPQRVIIASITDEAPVVETQLRGIGSSITRKAVIPLQGRITDDYGVVSANYEYRVDEEPSSHLKPLKIVPPGTPPSGIAQLREVKLETSATQPTVKFEVLPLELKLGQKLTVALQAHDGDTLTGPHISTSERYTFQIIGDEELLSLLYARELNLRLRFEQILTEIKRSQSELITSQPRLKEWEELRQNPSPTGDASQFADQIAQLLSTVQTASERGLYGIRKNHNETQAIEQSLGDIREEMVNNGVATPASLERIDDKLLKPLQQINTQDFPELDQALGLLKLAVDKQANISPQLAPVFPLLERLIRRMEAVLVEMRRLETYKELLEKLKAIKTLQEELKRRTEAENKRGLLDKLK